MTIEKAQNPPRMAPQYRQVGEVTRITGKVTGDVTVTMPVPESYPGSLDELWIVKNDGDTWLPLIPQTVDQKNRTVSITTRAFSFWTLGTWHAEEAAARWAADLRNLTSSDGAWVISDAAKLTGNAPVTECRIEQLAELQCWDQLTPRNGHRYGGPTQYRAGVAGSGRFPTAVVWLYDPIKGVVLEVIATSGPRDGLTADDVLKEAQAAADYAAHKADVSLGTSYALGG